MIALNNSISDADIDEVLFQTGPWEKRFIWGQGLGAWNGHATVTVPCGHFYRSNKAMTPVYLDGQVVRHHERNEFGMAWSPVDANPDVLAALLRGLERYRERVHE